MSEQELMLKTNHELTALADELVVKIKMLRPGEKATMMRAIYFEELQTIMKIIRQRAD